MKITFSEGPVSVEANSLARELISAFERFPSDDALAPETVSRICEEAISSEHAVELLHHLFYELAFMSATLIAAAAKDKGLDPETFRAYLFTGIEEGRS